MLSYEITKSLSFFSFCDRDDFVPANVYAVRVWASFVIVVYNHDSNGRTWKRDKYNIYRYSTHQQRKKIQSKIRRNVIRLVNNQSSSQFYFGLFTFFFVFLTHSNGFCLPDAFVVFAELYTCTVPLHACYFWFCSFALSLCLYTRNISLSILLFCFYSILMPMVLELAVAANKYYICTCTLKQTHTIYDDV